MRLCNIRMPAIRVGEQKSTVRRGEKWFDQVQVGDQIDLCFCPDGMSGKHKVVGKGKVTDLRLMCFINLPSEVLEGNHSGPQTYSGLLEVMEKAYPGFRPQEKVTVLTYIRMW